MNVCKEQRDRESRDSIGMREAIAIDRLDHRSDLKKEIVEGWDGGQSERAGRVMRAEQGWGSKHTQREMNNEVQRNRVGASKPAHTHSQVSCTHTRTCTDI